MSITGNLLRHAPTLVSAQAPLGLKTLEAKEENAIIKKAQAGDQTAQTTLITYHQKAVHEQANRRGGYKNVSAEDLIQEGNIGLLKAIHNYDPEHKVRLYTFASRWIGSSMDTFIFEQGNTLRLYTTRTHRKLFFKLKSTWSKHGSLPRDKRVQAVALELDVKPCDVENMLLRQTPSFIENGFDERDLHPCSTSTSTPSVEEIVSEEDSEFHQSQSLANAINLLDQREKSVVTSRHLSEVKGTLKGIGAEYGISAERVRQIENRALAKLKSELGHLHS